MIQNTQKPLKPIYSESGTLNIHHYFLTIQGEGPFVGRKALFFRFYGCNLQCPQCDTEYTSQRHSMTADDILETTMQYLNKGDLVVFSGGEPLRQNVWKACELLNYSGFPVQIETNGVFSHYNVRDIFTLLPRERNITTPVPMSRPVEHHYPGVTIVCSPKTSKIHPAVMERADAFKYVLDMNDIHPEDGLPNKALGHKASPHVARPRPGAPVYVQPVDVQDEVANQNHLAATIDVVMEYGYILCVQTHKLIGLE